MMSKKNREATDFWNKVSAEQEQLQGMKSEQYERDVARNEEGASAEREKMQMGITTTPKVHPMKDE